uniref:Dna polymerase B n=2 Tax=root TaxID=1 RepID=A0A8S5RXN5_9CAUD|nr:MAG TPA: Dna polymerase B [Siphoviridae sp. ctEJG5]
MAVFRVHKTKNYTLMSNHHLRDKNLSLKAKGLLSVMFSLPDSWNYSIPGLCAILKENETAVKSTIKELKATGYLVVDKKKPCKEEGRSKFEYIYNIYETPQEVPNNDIIQAPPQQGIENLPLETPGVEHHPHNKRTDILTTDKSITDTDKDFILSNKEKKTLPKNGKGSKTSAPNNINILDINNIPSRTTEQKEVYRKQKQKNRSEKYRDEDVPQILYNEFDSLYGEQGNVLEDHDICLTMAVVAYYFKQYREHMGEQHIMISAEYADQFMGVIIGDDSPLLKADVEEKDELRFYQDMIDEFFKSDLGQRNGKSFDRHIWLFFAEENQRILCERVKQKWDNQEYID